MSSTIRSRLTIARHGRSRGPPSFICVARTTRCMSSPDGKWLAYASTEIGNRREIFVQPFPPTGAKYQISTEGGTTPLWSPDGTQLYYYGPNQRLIAVDVRAQP